MKSRKVDPRFLAKISWRGVEFSRIYATLMQETFSFFCEVKPDEIPSFCFRFRFHFRFCIVPDFRVFPEGLVESRDGLAHVGGASRLQGRTDHAAGRFRPVERAADLREGRAADRDGRR